MTDLIEVLGNKETAHTKLDANIIRKRAKGIDHKCLRLSRHTLAKLACIGGGPCFHKFGKLPKYTIFDLDTWVDSRLSRRVTSTCDFSQSTGGGQK